MIDTNPPQEWGTTNVESDAQRNISRLAELLRVAESECAGERRQALLREFRSEMESDFDNVAGELTCCIGGSTTRQMPCRNREWPGCPFNERGRERSRNEYER